VADIFLIGQGGKKIFACRNIAKISPEAIVIISLINAGFMDQAMHIPFCWR
jgi:hypothetical protein